MNARYRAMEMHYLERVPTLELTGAGLWLRQRNSDQRYLLACRSCGDGPVDPVAADGFYL